MSWTDDTNDNTEQEENLIALGLMDVENELKKNNKLVLDLKREQREQYKTTNNELQERIALEMQNLKNQKERDMEDLAYKIAQQLQNNSNEIYKNYIDSSKSTFESLRVKIQGEINRNTAELTILADKNAQYERAVAALEYNKQNQDKKELIFNVAMAVGLVLVSLKIAHNTLEFPAISQTCQRNFNGAYSGKGRPSGRTNPDRGPTTVRFRVDGAPLYGVAIDRMEEGGTGERSDEGARLAAVDGDACAGHEARLLGCQKDHDGGDLLWAAESAQRQLILDELGDLDWVLALPPVPGAARKERRAWRDAVDMLSFVMYSTKGRNKQGDARYAKRASHY